MGRSGGRDILERPAADSHRACEVAVTFGVLEEDESRQLRYLQISLDSADHLCTRRELALGVAKFELPLLLASHGGPAAAAPEVERVEAEDAHGLLVEVDVIHHPDELVFDITILICLICGG